MLKMHSHSFCEINIVISGIGRHYIENRYCKAEPGMVFVLPQSISHGYFAPGGITVMHILLSNTFMEKHKQELTSFSAFSVMFEIEPLLRGEYRNDLFLKLNDYELQDIMKYFDRLCKLQIDSKPETEKLKSLIVLAIIGEFLNLMGKQKISVNNTADYEKKLNAMHSMEYIRSNFFEKNVLKNAAESIGVSYPTFVRIFEEYSGNTPSHFLNEYKIERARTLLMTTDEKITNIGINCGFYDSSHFVKVFRNKTGLSPSDYRKKTGKP